MRKEKIASNYEMRMPEEQFGRGEFHENPSYMGIIISLLIIFLTFILGGLYVWSGILQKQNVEVTEEVPEARPTAEENNEPESATAEAVTQTLETTSFSDELSAIEADLSSTRVESLEGDFVTVENALR